MELLAWWNLLFLVPGALGIVLVFVSSVGVGQGHGDAGGHDVGQHDAGMGHAHGNGHDSQGTSSGIVPALLALLGVGRAPLASILSSLLLVYGFTGFVANRLLSGSLPPAVFAPLAFVAAGLVSVAATSAFARVFGKLLPQDETYAASTASLAGCTGKITLLLNGQEGYAQIEDPFGNMQEVRCRSARGQPLSQGLAIVITQVTEEKVCLCVEDETSAPGGTPRAAGATTKEGA